MKIRPMLAGKAPDDLSQLNYPVLVSPKLDGVRALIVDGVVMSRSMKPIRNEYIQKVLGKSQFNGLDGELIVGDATDRAVYRNTNSGVMSINGSPDFKYYVFDLWDSPRKRFESRLHRLSCTDPLLAPIILLTHSWAHSEEELLMIEERFLSNGYEGVMIRDPDAPYKFGRSTVKEGYLLKLKRFMDGEAVIIGFEELMHNDNTATTNELGYTERSKSREKLRLSNSLGAFVVRCPKTGVEFKIGTGFTLRQRSHFWHQKEAFKGALVKYKYLNIGVKDAPRHPVFLGFRDVIDM